jgi:hypothetical protein
VSLKQPMREVDPTAEPSESRLRSAIRSPSRPVGGTRRKIMHGDTLSDMQMDRAVEAAEADTQAALDARRHRINAPVKEWPLL